MEKVLNFLNNLRLNNNRSWFEEHKGEYKEALEIFNSFTEKLITGIGSFDPSVKNLTVKDCTYRIYRDVRFSTDKSPYKTHMGAFISPKGKGSGYSGYYFHIEAKGSEYIGGHILSTGIYRPAPVVVKNIREEIMLNGKEFQKTIDIAYGFKLDSGDALKRIPAGFPADNEYSEYFKLKDYFLMKFVDDSFILGDNLLERTVNEYKKTLAFNSLLNKVVDYAYEDNL
ncbi:MAG: TIGR02453 family protein [Bacteroidetes bacterium HGW-Bacteroidetes-7]|jgi:uncharacterized protein (TIGR02453 family)|nr:MAG: TIGR02453 family protein [Bacteroidetes bacterium HGW-Bacteroidetes-7]